MALPSFGPRPHSVPQADEMKKAANWGGLFHFKPNVRCLLLADIVAKRFFTSRRATLIQKMNPSRKIDSNGALVGFESCSLGGGRRLLQQYLPTGDNTGPESSDGTPSKESATR